MSRFLILARKHCRGSDIALWWRPESCGYTTDVDQAGRYTAEQADRICSGAHGEHMAVAEESVLKAVHRIATKDRLLDAGVAVYAAHACDLCAWRKKLEMPDAEEVDQ